MHKHAQKLANARSSENQDFNAVWETENFKKLSNITIAFFPLGKHDPMRSALANKLAPPTSHLHD